MELISLICGSGASVLFLRWTLGVDSTDRIPVGKLGTRSLREAVLGRKGSEPSARASRWSFL